MGFGTGSFAKVKSVEVKEKYTVCKLSVSKKNKDTNKYETIFVGKCRFIGKAHNQKPQEGQKIKLVNIDVQNCYVKDDKIEFLNVPTYIVWDYELQDSDGYTSQSSVPSISDLAQVNEELPF